ncbi:MAG: PLP-dependent transferase [Thermoanaerobaculia bacterium]|nr:PLP-dependent transferase [Thermoanaerobaculia bacterium]
MRFSSTSIDTLATHAGRDGFAELGVHAPPIDLSSTYPFPDLDQATAALDAFAAGAATAATPIYGRLHNPTVARFEAGLAALEGAEEAVAFGSGMAAITAVLLAASAHGRHVVAVRPLYGGTDHLLASGLLGIEASFVGVHEVAGALRPDTALVLVETPGNPTLSLVDIADVVRQAGAVPVAVDSTFATPVLQRPLAHGATYSIHSATKFLSGHGDVIAGVVACSAAAAAGLRQLRILTGALLHPWAAYLLHRSLPTLPLRVRRAQESAGLLATQLAAHPGVTRVLYPGLPGGDPEQLVGRQMSGAGAILAFELAGGAAAARLVLQNVKLATPAVSLGSTDTLIEHPAGLTHRLVDPQALAAEGISPGLLRLSVGIEDPADIWRDLETALLLAAETPARQTQLAEARLQSPRARG